MTKRVRKSRCYIANGTYDARTLGSGLRISGNGTMTVTGGGVYGVPVGPPTDGPPWPTQSTWSFVKGLYR